MTEYRSIVVHLDRGERSAERLRLALMLAARVKARLTGLFALSGPLRLAPAAADESLDAALGHAAEPHIHEAVEFAEAEFRKAVAAGAHPEAHWEVAKSDALESLRTVARYSDLLVVGHQVKGDEARTGVASDVLQELVLSAGRPVLVLPREGRTAEIGTRVQIAWRESREAARAVADALPVITRAEAVDIAVVEGRNGERAGREASANALATYLSLHGARGVSVRVLPREHDTGATMLRHARDIDADLLVMGAYGHSRLTEIVLGGMTRSVLRNLPLPVLMSH